MMQTITVYGPGGYDPDKPNDNIIRVEEIEVPDPPAPDPAALAAIEHARTLGFTDDMIRAMYPALAEFVI